MLSRLQEYFSDHLAPGVDPDREHGINLAAAALLIEVARADVAIGEEEARCIEALLVQTLDLGSEEVGDLVQLARAEIAEGASLHQFTHLINQHYDIAAKRRFMEQLWRVAWSDGRLHHYEEHLLRRLADLLHLRHHEFMKAKHAVIGDD
jgi:uncharacterized tellurite resistance protein B-like protein